MIPLFLCLAFALGWLLGRLALARSLADTLRGDGSKLWREPRRLWSGDYYVVPETEYLRLTGRLKFDLGDAP